MTSSVVSYLCDMGQLAGSQDTESSIVVAGPRLYATKGMEA